MVKVLPFEFQKNSNFDLILRQMWCQLAAKFNCLLHVWKCISSSKERWNPHQNWLTKGDNIAIWM